MQGFYDACKDNGFFNGKTKIASNEDAKNALNGLDQEQIDTLAQALGVFGKQASDAAEEKSVEDKVTDAAKAKAEKTDKPDDKKGQDKKDAKADEEKADPATSETSEKKASEVLREILTEGAEMEAQIEKDAFERAGEMLKQAGYSVAQYVYGFIEDEKIATVIADEAEKIASEEDMPVLQVARDIVTEILSSITSE